MNEEITKAFLDRFDAIDKHIAELKELMMSNDHKQELRHQATEQHQEKQEEQNLLTNEYQKVQDSRIEQTEKQHQELTPEEEEKAMKAIEELDLLQKQMNEKIHADS